jgi:deoxyribonucleoside regulator
MNDAAAQFDRVKLAARLYYVDGLSQSEIARNLEISQAMVSRFLQAARDKGIVRFVVAEYQPRDSGLEEQLRSTYGIGRAVVIRTLAESSLDGVRRNVGYFGAPVVAEMIRAGQVIGLTGGRTLAELIRPIKAQTAIRDLRVVQLMGSIGAAVNDNDAVELSRRVAEQFGGSWYALNTPAFVSSAAGRNALLGQDQVKGIWDLYGTMSLALVGIGTLRESAFIDRGVLDPSDLARLEKAGAVGEICGRFYDADGQECQTDFRKRVVSIELDELSRVAEVIGVTAGAGRAEAVAIALRAGLIKSLIVDEQCARAVLASAEQGSGRRRGAKTHTRSTR